MCGGSVIMVLYGFGTKVVVISKIGYFSLGLDMVLKGIEIKGVGVD